MAEAMDAAIRYLNIKPRTGAQVAEYLKRKNFDEEDIGDVVAELAKYHYIDDLRYSVMYFEYGFEKGRGISRIRRELTQKGVDRDVIDAAYDELESVPDQYEAARKLAEEMTDGADVENLDYDEKRRIRARVGRRLASRGFTTDIIYRVINNL